MEQIRGWRVQRIGNRNMWILFKILLRCIYVTERLTQRAWEQQRDLGIGRGIKSWQAGAALPLHSVVEALESKNWEEGTQTMGRVHSVCTGHVTCFSEDSRVMSVSLESAQSVSFSPPISHVASCYFHLSRWVVWGVDELPHLAQCLAHTNTWWTCVNTRLKASLCSAWFFQLIVFSKLSTKKKQKWYPFPKIRQSYCDVQVP